MVTSSPRARNCRAKCTMNEPIPPARPLYCLHVIGGKRNLGHQDDKSPAHPIIVAARNLVQKDFARARLKPGPWNSRPGIEPVELHPDQPPSRHLRDGAATSCPRAFRMAGECGKVGIRGPTFGIMALLPLRAAGVRRPESETDLCVHLPSMFNGNSPESPL